MGIFIRSSIAKVIYEVAEGLRGTFSCSLVNPTTYHGQLRHTGEIGDGRVPVFAFLVFFGLVSFASFVPFAFDFVVVFVAVLELDLVVDALDFAGEGRVGVEEIGRVKRERATVGNGATRLAAAREIL